MQFKINNNLHKILPIIITNYKSNFSDFAEYYFLPKRNLKLIFNTKK